MVGPVPIHVGIDLARGDSWTSFRCVCGFTCTTAMEMIAHVRRAHASIPAAITQVGSEVLVEAFGFDAFDDPRD